MRLTTIMLCLFACISASGQKTAERTANLSIDIAAIITDRDMRLGFSHSVTGKWSAETGASLQILRSSEIPEEEAGHDSMLSDGDEEMKFRKLRPEFRIGMKFWPGEYSEGWHLGIYCIHGLSSGTDLAIGFGYAAAIWRNIGISAGYELKLLDSVRRERFGTEGITIKLNYSF